MSRARPPWILNFVKKSCETQILKSGTHINIQFNRNDAMRRNGNRTAHASFSRPWRTSAPTPDPQEEGICHNASHMSCDRRTSAPPLLPPSRPLPPHTSACWADSQSRACWRNHAVVSRPRSPDQPRGMPQRQRRSSSTPHNIEVMSAHSAFASAPGPRRHPIPGPILPHQEEPRVKDVSEGVHFLACRQTWCGEGGQRRRGRACLSGKQAATGSCAAV